MEEEPVEKELVVEERSVVFVPLDTDAADELGDASEPERPRWRTGVVVASLIGAALVSAVVARSCQADDETPAAAPVAPTELTTPPTLPPVDPVLVPPIESPPSVDAPREDVSPPTTERVPVPARDPSAFRGVSGPRFDRIDGNDSVEFPEVDVFAAITDLAEERSRFAILRVLDGEGVETVVETTRDVTSRLDRIEVSGSDGVDRTVIIDRIGGWRYSRPADSDVWYRSDAGSRPGGAGDDRLVDRYLGGLMPSDIVVRAETLLVASGSSVWELPSGPAKRFGIYVDWQALRGSVTLEFADLPATDVLLPDQILVNVYVDADHRVVMTTNRLVAGGRVQVMTHRIEDLSAAPLLTLPDPSVVVELPATNAQ